MKELLKTNKVAKVILVCWVLAISLLAIISFGRSYAFFTSEVEEINPGSEKVNITTAKISIDYNGGSEINAPAIEPGWTISKTFTVKNNNVNTEKYSIVWREVMNTFQNNADLVYSIIGAEDKSETVAPLGDGAILVNIEIGAGNTHVYTLTMTYKNRGQETEDDATFYGHIKITKDGEEIRNDGIANQDKIEELINNKIADAKIEIKTEFTNTLKRNNPIGTIITTTNSANPSTYLGFGTWQTFGVGRTLVGVDSAQTEFNVVEKVGGSKTNTLVTANLPSHIHSIPSLSGTAASAGTHTHGINNGHAFIVTGLGAPSNVTAGGGGYIQVWTTDSSGEHTHNISTTANVTGSTGSGTAINNLQPYITTYMWKRVS